MMLFLLGVFGGMILSFVLAEQFYNAQLQDMGHRITAAENELVMLSAESESDALIAEEARQLFLTWFTSKRSLVTRNVVEGSVIRAIENLGSLIISLRGMEEFAPEILKSKVVGLPDFTRKLERVYENGEVWLREADGPVALGEMADV